MDAVETCLREAVAFQQQGNKKAVYYKIVEGIFQIITVLERGSMYNLDPMKELLPKYAVEELCASLQDLLHKAEIILPDVCELTKDAAENYSRALSSQTGIRMSGQKPGAEPYIQLSMAEASPSIHNSPVLGVMDEPVPVKVDSEPVPFIPTSLLDIERHSIVMQLQLVMQKLAKYSEASAKARSNAAYISGLRSCIEEIIISIKRKLELEGMWKRCQNDLVLTDIHPEIMARQLTLLDARIFHSLPIDLLSSNAPGRDFGQEFSDFHTFILAMVQFEILGPKEQQDRVRALNHWIGIALELDNLHSFNMLKAVTGAMTSPGVHKAKGLKEGLSQSREYELRKMKERVGLTGNFRILRNEMNELTFTGHNAVPYLKVYLTDLEMLYASQRTDARAEREQRAQEIERIFGRLEYFQQTCQNFIETIAPDVMAQHWILTRPFKNSQELDNLAVSRTSSGGVFSPSSSASIPSPTIIEFGDEGRILFDNFQRQLLK